MSRWRWLLIASYLGCITGCLPEADCFETATCPPPSPAATEGGSTTISDAMARPDTDGADASLHESDSVTSAEPSIDALSLERVADAKAKNDSAEEAEVVLTLACDSGSLNACGGCGALPNSVGTLCGQCGQYACGPEAGAVVCSDPGPNNCGACGPLPPNLGTACGQCGHFVCGHDGGIECLDPGQNACGGCSILANRPGDPCGQCGKFACAAGGESVSCQDPGILPAIAIAAGGRVAEQGHTCALTALGGVRCWGFNESGQLGDGTTVDRFLPPSTDVLTGVQQIAAGGIHTCALTATSMQCWGDNSLGQLGDGTMASHFTPVVSWNGALQSMALGDYHSTCALTRTGGVRCWGYFIAPTRVDPPASDDFTGANMIAVGNDHWCAITTSGGARCWGNNDFGQLGTGMIGPPSVPAPGTADIDPVHLGPVVSITAGGYHTCTIDAFSNIQCWGGNQSGQLGDGTQTDRAYPTGLIFRDAVQVSAGGRHTCAIANNGDVYCWGDNSFGQIGDGTTISRSIATPIGLAGVRAIAAGSFHTCALMRTGGVRCWGDNSYGELGVGHPSGSVTAPPTADVRICQ